MNRFEGASALVTGASRGLSESPQGGEPGAPGDAAEMPVIDDFETLVDTVIAHEQVFVRYSRGPRTDGQKKPGLRGRGGAAGPFGDEPDP